MAWYTFVEQQLKHLLISKLALGSLETNFYSICRLFQDKFDNLTGENLKGKVVVKVTTPSEGIDEIPALTGNVYSLEVPLVKGVATVQNLLIQENTAGKDCLRWHSCFTMASTLQFHVVLTFFFVINLKDIR